MTKEQVILAYIPDLLARIVTQLDFEYWSYSKDISVMAFAMWSTTKEGSEFWLKVNALEVNEKLTESEYICLANSWRIPVTDMFVVNEILSKAKEIHDRKQMFEALKTLVELDFTDGGSRVIGSNEIREMKVVKDFTRFTIEVPGKFVNDVYLGRKRALLLIVDAAEYDKVDNDGL
jgi:hypothetical protein